MVLRYTVTHYDVEFDDLIVENMQVEELEILVSDKKAS